MSSGMAEEGHQAECYRCVRHRCSLHQGRGWTVRAFVGAAPVFWLSLSRGWPAYVVYAFEEIKSPCEVVRASSGYEQGLKMRVSALII